MTVKRFWREHHFLIVALLLAIVAMVLLSFVGCAPRVIARTAPIAVHAAGPVETCENVPIYFTDGTVGAMRLCQPAAKAAAK